MTRMRCLAISRKRKRKRRTSLWTWYVSTRLEYRCRTDESLAQPEEASGTSTPLAEDLDFSDLKKKKKSTKKKAALDMEAFEKELNEAKARDEEEEGDVAPVNDGDEDLGDDPFARGSESIAVDGGNEPWLSSDRDYIYPEVRPVS